MEIMEWSSLQKTKGGKNCHMTPLQHFWVYTQKHQKHPSIAVPHIQIHLLIITKANYGISSGAYE
jgi:hypothetical protein